MIPVVTKVELNAISVEADGTCTCLKDDGSLKEDVKLPADDEELSNEVKRLIDEGKDVWVSIISACGQEKIISTRTK